MRNALPKTAYFLAMSRDEPSVRPMEHVYAYATVHLRPNSIAPQWAPAVMTKKLVDVVSGQVILVRLMQWASTFAKETSFCFVLVANESPLIAQRRGCRAFRLPARTVAIAVDVVANHSMLLRFHDDAVPLYW
jgi:hypothetical protein